MQEKLFIPKKIKVGFQHRDDTYTKRLAYIIYYDEKGKLRKQTSWEGWRDKNIPSKEFENKPHSGFVINKDVQRSSEWFGSGRNMIRIYDDRGMEFEITCDNLMFILMSTDCLKRGLQGEFVYAWQGKELILLPTDCEEYKISEKFTELKSKKILKKDLVPGCSFKDKQMQDLIYLGYFEYNTFDVFRKEASCQEMFIFINNNNHFVPLKTLSTIAEKNSDIPVSNYAELMDLYNQSEFSSPVTNLLSNPTDINLDNLKYNYFHAFEKINNNTYKKILIQKKMKYDYSIKGQAKQVFEGFLINEQETITFDSNNHKNHIHCTSIPYKNYLLETRQLHTFEEIKQKNLVELYIIKKNGTKIKLN